MEAKDLIQWFPFPTSRTTSGETPRKLKLTLVVKEAEQVPDYADNVTGLTWLHFRRVNARLRLLHQPRVAKLPPLQQRLQNAKEELDRAETALFREALPEALTVRSQCHERLLRVLALGAATSPRFLKSAECYLQDQRQGALEAADYAWFLKEWATVKAQVVAHLKCIKNEKPCVCGCLVHVLLASKEVTVAAVGAQAWDYIQACFNLPSLRQLLSAKEWSRSLGKEAERVTRQFQRSRQSPALHDVRRPSFQRKSLRGPKARESYLRSLGNRKKHVVRASWCPC